MTRELVTKSPSGRVKRTPLGQRNRLTVKDKDPNFHYRIVNTTTGSGSDRIQEFKEAGWTVVDTEVGDKRVDTTSGLGKTSEISVGNGVKALVMRIPREYHDEDQAAKMAYLKEQEETMYQDAKADYGSIKQSLRPD